MIRIFATFLIPPALYHIVFNRVKWQEKWARKEFCVLYVWELSLMSCDVQSWLKKLWSLSFVTGINIVVFV